MNPLAKYDRLKYIETEGTTVDWRVEKMKRYPKTKRS